MDSYLFLKSAHLLGITIFLGNIIVTAVWKTLADRTGRPIIVAFAQRVVTVTDIAFTALGVALILVSGKMMAAKFGAIGDVFWLTWGWWLFIASGGIWILILIPIQIWQAKMAKGFAQEDEIPQAYWALSRKWAAFGIVATLLPLINIYLMVFKPT